MTSPPTSDCREDSSPIEKQLKLISSPEKGRDTFVNQFPLWRPGARGIFGGIAIAQSLRAAQATVDDKFHVHSMHCSFIFAGKPDMAITYSVERVRDGRSFCTRSVRATQHGRPIFIANISFALPVQATNIVEHAETPPPNVPFVPEVVESPVKPHGIPSDTPFINKSVGVRSLSSSAGPQDKRMHQWIKAQGVMPSDTGMHLAALAFMSDSYFLAAVPHSHEIWHFEHPPVTEFYQTTQDIFSTSTTHSKVPRPHYDLSPKDPVRPVREVAMMVSLDHTIYFHNQSKLRADEWLLAEVHTSWAGESRGLMHQRIWSRDGVLLATCIQEGIVRLGSEKSSRL
ncbi:hypothetical protein FE257_006274 [Aspergillus nanangensis]|uniref:Acyl-CoA thioesterase II n=1 Tax=Aspergillus nanangensis TaxID=2582783 RepID=A0AAD4GW33_ASPNN|nr:hypothetical protein FE257_006274 [Aspergillus nanangensis]